jgi:hypothetical protein
VPGRSVRLPALVGLALSLLLPSCTETDEALVRDIGVVRLILVDPGLGPQSLEEPDATIQVTRVDVTRARLTYGDPMGTDPPPVDRELLGPQETCTFTDTATQDPVVTGPCAEGLVIDSFEDERPLTLTLTFSMRVARAEPLALAPDADADGDGLINHADPCPLIADTREAREPGEPFRNPLDLDVCRARQEDMDGDGVRDDRDNCIWADNPAQEDEEDDLAGEVPDLIGPVDVDDDDVYDICREQVADVVGDTVDLELSLTAFTQPLNRVTFLVLDLDTRRVLSRAACTWGQPSARCDLAASAIRLCTTTSGFAAVAGCGGPRQ